MANRRDLHIGITGDSAGFDKACEDAEVKARGLDRELEKLNKDLTAQERVAARTAVAVKAYGSEQDKAALAARRLGTEAENAAQRAEKAVTRADAAAQAYERGLIDEATAAKAAAAAETALERAAIKAAEAHRAAARAADEQAQQERQLARDAELAAAAEQLGHLKASGQIQQHNALLGGLQAKYGDLSKTAVAGFEEIETVGSKVGAGIDGLMKDFSILGQSGPVSLGLVAAAIRVLPAVASTAGGGVALALGGALSLVAIKAQASTADVKGAFAGLKTEVGNDLRSISAPFHATLLEVAADAEAAFKSLEPALAAAFAQMGPAITRFVRYFAGSLGELDPAIRSIGTAFSAVLDTLGPQMSTVMNNIGTGIKAITDAAASNPQALANLVTGLSEIVRYTGDAIGWLVRYSDQIGVVFGAIDKAINPLGEIEGWIRKLTGSTEAGGKAIAPYTSALGQVPGVTSAASTPTQQLAKDMATMGNSAASAADRTTALSDALTRFFDPALAAYEDTAKLRQGFDQLAAAAKKSHGAMNDNSAAAAEAKLKFAALLHDTEQYAKDLTNSGDHLDVVQGKLAPYILALYKAAGANKQARQMVDQFVKTLQMVPPKKSTLLYSNAAQATRAVQAYQRQLNALHDRTITITTLEITHRTLQADRARAMGGYVGYADGGMARHFYPSGGAVSGPGTATSDSIPAMLSNGEFVINAASTRQYRPLLEAINSGRPVPVARAVMSGASGGASAPVDYDRLAGAVAVAMRREGVGAAYLDGQAITDNVNRRIGRQTDQRRRTG